MKKQLFGVLLTAVINTACAGIDEWPKLLGERSYSECKAAYELAQTVHKSQVFNVWNIQILPKKLEETLVLGPLGFDLSGGNALRVDLNVFTKIPLPQNQSRSIYWQTKTDARGRVVIEEIPHGWRGDAYAVRLIPIKISPADYFSNVAPQRTSASHLTTLINEGWRAPLFFQEKSTNHLWFIYLGEPYNFSPSWIIYLLKNDQEQKTCEVRFRPDVPNAALLLPKPVQRLATLLDRSIGSGEGEGTLQPTARIRIDVQQAWSNAALRPWAMGTPYNSHEEVDIGLSEWAEINTANKVIHMKIQAQYKIAQRALETYYGSYFKMSTIDSRTMAKTTLDITYRTHYIFSR